MRYVFVSILLLLTGCGVNGGDMSTEELLNALSLTDCEIGRVIIDGTVSVGTGVWGSGSLHVLVEETHTVDDLPAHCSQLSELSEF